MINEKNELVVDLVLSNTLPVDVTVEINSEDVTATGKGKAIKIINNLVYYFSGENVDYKSGPYNVTVLARNTTGFLSIMLNDDELLESTEEFNLTIDLSSFPVGIFPGNHIEALVVIVDNDGNNNVIFIQHF